jgi:hypothetical protein
MRKLDKDFPKFQQKDEFKLGNSNQIDGIVIVRQQLADLLTRAANAAQEAGLLPAVRSTGSGPGKATESGPR